MERVKTLLTGGTVVTTSETCRADVLIDGERIAAVGTHVSTPDAMVLDVSGKHVLPGGIDVHTHLDMPLGDIRSSDDFYSGHVAAAFGGTTTHIDFANQSGGQSLGDTLAQWHGMAADKACIDYGFHITLTDVNEDTLDEIASLPDRGVTTVKMLMAYKGRVMVEDGDLFLAMERARDAGLLTMVHCENGDVIDVLVRQALAAGRTAPLYHALTRPPQLEGEATGRAIAMAEILGAPLYVVHVTCRQALAPIAEAQARGAPVHAETCTQYLFFTKQDLDREDVEGAKWVCSPPFRERQDHDALWDALRDGVLSAVSTDHCPFFFEGQKTLGRDDFSKIPNGCPGIEDRLKVLHHAGVNGGRISLERFVALTSMEPARLFGLERKGRIAPGYDADLAIWDMDREEVITAAGSHSRTDYNLYEGMRVRGVPERVFSRGRLIVDGQDFQAEPGSGRFVHRRRSGG